jgi:GDP-4-dehydro-6-deoxy-D-mannose reductase
MKKVLITGITGQTGSHLADYILSSHPDWQVHGTVRYRSDMSNVHHIKDKITLHDCELRDAHNVDLVINKVRPDKVFHLAATSFVRSSWDQPADIITNNTISQINLFESLRRYAPKAKVQVACSSEQFGKVEPHEIPITENNALRPISPYAVSKCAQENLAYQYYQSHKLHTVITRTFNHTGPRRGDAFVESSFCKQIAMIEVGLQTPLILHGNLDSVRDYTDARDIAEAYWMALDHCEPGEPYNICSNSRITIGELLQMLIKLSTYEGKIETRIDPARLRPSDVVLLYGSSTKFNDATGWEPKYSLEQTMADLLYMWRKRARLIKAMNEACLELAD